MNSIWIERQPRRGAVRRWWLACKDQLLATIFAVVVICWLTALTLITLGEYPSGPVAGLSTLHRDHLRSPSSCSIGHDPYIASRADHGHLVGGAAQ